MGKIFMGEELMIRQELHERLRLDTKHEMTVMKIQEKNHDFITPQSYVSLFETEYNIKLYHDKQQITSSYNGKEPIHRWSSYIQGFSAKFVNSVLSKYGMDQSCSVLDPFSGSGTTLICAKRNGIESLGIEINPLLAFTSRAKTNWNVMLEKIKETKRRLRFKLEPSIDPPDFLLTEKQFNPKVLKNLLIIKESILAIDNREIQDLFKLAFSSILVPCSNLKRSPCLGYAKNKKVRPSDPLFLFNHKIQQIIEDLGIVQKETYPVASTVIEGDSRTIKLPSDYFNIAITSPPYASGMDYIMNYKIEMAWLDFIKSHKEAANLKKRMVVCDNVSRVFMRSFRERREVYSNKWIDIIFDLLQKEMEERDKYRRRDMHFIVKKYFDDLYQVMRNVFYCLDEKGLFVIVIGDSLIADVYIPTDLILAKIGYDIGFSVVDVNIARKRRSGQKRGFQLRESIVTLTKGDTAISQNQSRLSEFAEF